MKFFICLVLLVGCGSSRADKDSDEKKVRTTGNGDRLFDNTDLPYFPRRCSLNPNIHKWPGPGPIWGDGDFNPGFGGWPYWPPGPPLYRPEPGPPYYRPEAAPPHYAPQPAPPHYTPQPALSPDRPEPTPSPHRPEQGSPAYKPQPGSPHSPSQPQPQHPGYDDESKESNWPYDYYGNYPIYNSYPWTYSKDTDDSWK